MWGAIAKCAALCAASYDDDAVGFVTVGDLRYGLFHTEFGRIVVIRGSDNVENWLRNARVWPRRSMGGCLAHDGFVRAHHALRAAGMPQGDLITGHSLGGAIATLEAERTGCRLVTFGAPKVYWRFGRAPRLNHTRVVRDDDPVPRLPAFLYSHRDSATVLRDSDGALVDVSDHFMAGYVAALPASAVG